MHRRDFITLLGGAMAAGPRRLHAQQSAVPIIGFLHARAAEDSVAQVTAFRRGLAENGYIEGETIFLEYRWGGGQYDQLPRLASELVRRPVALLVTGAEPAALAAKAVTSSIPIVFSVGTDPVKLGLVRSFNQPGGNATGMYILTTSLGTKRLGLLHEVMPRVEIIGVLSNPSFPAAQAQMGELQAAAEALGLRVRMFSASSIQEIDAAP